jgi:hypothetical protein
MKAELLILNGQVLEEKDWPDDYTPDAMKHDALALLRNYWEPIGGKLVKKHDPYAYAVRVAHNGQPLFWTITQLAQELGVEPP